MGSALCAWLAFAQTSAAKATTYVVKSRPLGVKNDLARKWHNFERQDAAVL